MAMRNAGWRSVGAVLLCRCEVRFALRRAPANGVPGRLEAYERMTPKDFIELLEGGGGAPPMFREHAENDTDPAA